MLLPKSRSVPKALSGPTETAVIAARLESIGRNLRLRYGWALRPLALGAVLRLLVFAAAVAGTQLIGLAGGARFPGILELWLRKDAHWYTQIAIHGYFSLGSLPVTANFFPLYPLSAAIVQHFTGLFPGLNSYLAASLVVSWVAFLAACVLLFRLVSDHFGDQTAYLAVLLLGLFPFSFYFGAPYAESLYVACAILAFLGIDRRNWWLAGTGALLAGATRPTGLIVGLAVVVAYFVDWLRTRHRLRWDLLALGLVPLGAVAFAMYCWVHFGNPLAYAVASSQYWQEHLQTAGIKYLISILIHPQSWIFGSLLDLIYALLVLGVLAACFPIYRLLGPSYMIFTLLSCIAPIVEFSSIKSTGRYVSVLFPVFMVLAYALQKRPVLRDMTIIGSSLLLAVCAFGFAGGYGFS
jgi:Gpi18-like mannosyltransferase